MRMKEKINKTSDGKVKLLTTLCACMYIALLLTFDIGMIFRAFIKS